jgi:hypothetical protein
VREWGKQLTFVVFLFFFFFFFLIAQAVVMCCLAKTEEQGWRVVPLGKPSSGYIHNYKPIIAAIGNCRRIVSHYTN